MAGACSSGCSPAELGYGGSLIGLAASRNCWRSGSTRRSHLARARQAREDAKRLLADRIDPAFEKKRRAQELSNAVAFRTVADEYVAKLIRAGRAEAMIAKTEGLLAFADADLGATPIRAVDAPCDQGEPSVT